MSITLDGYDPQELAAILESTRRIQCRAGLHCTPRMHEALGTTARGGTLRLSPGFATTTEEIDEALACAGRSRRDRHRIIMTNDQEPMTNAAFNHWSLVLGHWSFLTMDRTMSTTPEPWYKDGLRFKCTGCGDCCTGARLRVGQQGRHRQSRFRRGHGC